MVNHPQPSIGNDSNALAIPLASFLREKAEEFAAQQTNDHHADRVRRNTLAVGAVNQYLTLLDVATDLSAGDSWNAVIRTGEDVADLVLPGLGRLECRPFAPSEDSVPLPAEVQSDRIGYVAVELAPDLKQARILGFVPSLDANAPASELHRSDLHSREGLIDHLFRLEVLNRLLAEAEVTLPEELQAEVVGQLERVFLQEKREVLWGIKGESAIAGVVKRYDQSASTERAIVTSNRETVLPGERRQRQKLIQEVLQKLAQACDEEL